MVTTAKPKLPECTICRHSFRTNAKLVQHSVKTSHGADRCCIPCSRIFGAPAALEAHIKSSVHVTPASLPGPNDKRLRLMLSSSPAATDKKPECSTCQRSFETKAQLTEHCLHSGHGEDRCCRPCHRIFGSKQALKAHESSSACKRLIRRELKMSLETSLGSQAKQKEQFISCRGNNYQHIPQQNHHIVLQKLISQCHPMRTLQRHGYNVSEPIEDHKPGGPSASAQATGDDMLPLPPVRATGMARKAVAIDCEMAGVEGGASDLVSLTAIDFLTGEQLVHSLVRPRAPVVDWRTGIHGISPAAMAMARAGGLALDGWQAARAELLRHVDEDTVLVGHALNYDLAALHVRPARVVDSIILASDAIFTKKTGKPRYWGLGLKDMCSGLLGLKIRQNAGLGGSAAHDALEDALASRELVLCCLNQPGVYQAWVAEKRRAFFGAQARKAPKRRQQARRQHHAHSSRPYEAYSEDSEYTEDVILRWEDVVDYETWPKSPPDWD